MLVELDYGIYCSPSPSTFLRIRSPCIPDAELPLKTATEPNFSVKARYEGHEYGLMTLRESLGSEAVGIVHPASLALRLASTDETVETEMVFKMASTEFQRKQLLNEYFIYTHLVKKGVKCIIPVHGLFMDPESGTLSMLMEHDGESLFTRQARLGHRPDGQVFTSEEEKTAFRSALKDIHKARVYHGDIRAPNLLIAPDGGVRIIDFDPGKASRIWWSNLER